MLQKAHALLRSMNRVQENCRKQNSVDNLLVYIIVVFFCYKGIQQILTIMQFISN